MKKVIMYIILITLFFQNFNSALAYSEYEYENSDNQGMIEDKISEIYMVKKQYEDLMGQIKDEEPQIFAANNDAFWWPIGSDETTEVNGKKFAKGLPSNSFVTSGFGNRELRGSENNHSGLDMVGGRGLGETNVIAAKDGIVVFPNSLKGNDCPSRSSAEPCNGTGYGNYVVIQHADGNYTLYGHLYEDSIVVKAGDSVSQGQVIAKMGSSGNSTGAHLHFEIRIGQNAYSAVVDPADYVDVNNPRPASYGDELFNFLSFLEGSTEKSGDEYKVVNIGDGVRTVGHGVTLESNPDRFKQYGIEINNYPTGSYISAYIVDQIQKDILNYDRTYIEGVCASNSISLQKYQIDALITLMYQAGNINGFVKAYNEYGQTEKLFDNWWRFKGASAGFEAGVRNRRNYEWILFSTGVYSGK